MKLFEIFGLISLKGGEESTKKLKAFDKKAREAGESLRTLGVAMSGFGVVIAYILSTTSYLKLAKKNLFEIFTGTAALTGCLILLGFCINDLINDGIQYLIPFLIILKLNVIILVILLDKLIKK